MGRVRGLGGNSDVGNSRSADSSANRGSAPKMAVTDRGGIGCNSFPSVTKFSFEDGFNHTQGPLTALNYIHRIPRSRFPSYPSCCENPSHRSGPSSELADPAGCIKAFLTLTSDSSQVESPMTTVCSSENRCSGRPHPPTQTNNPVAPQIGEGATPTAAR